MKLTALERQKLKHFIKYANAEIVVIKQKLKGANMFRIKIKAFGKAFDCVGAYIDVTEELKEVYFKELFIKENSDKKLDEIFSYYTGNKSSEYFNRDVLNAIESKLKLTI